MDDKIKKDISFLHELIVKFREKYGIELEINFKIKKSKNNTEDFFEWTKKNL